MKIEQLMKRVLNEYQTINNEFVTLEEELTTINDSDNNNVYCSALKTMIQRLSEPIVKEVKTIVEPETIFDKTEESLHSGAVVLNSLLPCSVKEVSSLFLPCDFEKVNLEDKAVQTRTPSIEEIYQLFENIKLDEVIIKNVSNALKTIDTTGLLTIQNSEEKTFEVLSNHLSQDSELQVALLDLAQHHFQIPSVQCFVVAELLKDKNPVETIGTKAFSHIITKNPHVVGLLQTTMSVNMLNKNKLEKKKPALENIVFELHETMTTEIPVLNDYKLVSTGIKLAKTYPIIQRHGATNQQELQYIFHGLIDDFKTEPIQMPFITVAKRLSHPVRVQKTILEELYHNSSNIDYIGIKVLLKIVEETPLVVENIETYVSPEDFKKDKIKLEKSNIVNCCRLVSAIQSEEQLSLICNTIDNEMKTEVASTIEDLSRKLKFMYKVNSSEKLEWPETFNSNVENLKCQATLFDLSESLASSIYVRNVLLYEGLKNTLSSKTAGQLAFASVMENMAVHCQDTTSLVLNSIFKKDSVKKYLSICQNVSNVVSLAKERSSQYFYIKLPI